MTQVPGDAVNPAERRLLDHLGALREDPPRPPTGFTAAVFRRARWQGSVRPYLGAAGGFASAAAAAMRILFMPRGAQ